MKKWLAFISILLVLGILPQLIGIYYVNLLTLILIFAIFAMSFDLIQGYLDLPNLGHGAFYGVAAYIIGILSKGGLENFWLNSLLAIGMACVTAALFGLLVLRTRGAYFFMITLALSQMLWGIAINWRSLTQGDDGISGISRPILGFLPWPLNDAIIYYYFVFFFFIIAFILMYIMVHSPFGHVISGIRENELRMRALGYNTWLYKYIWLIISGLFAGLAGTLGVYYHGYAGPADLTAAKTAEGLLAVLVGGSGTLIGPTMGAGVIVLLQYFVSSFTKRWIFFLGLMFVIVVMYAPEGILGLIKKTKVRTRAKI
jgi:branched-chain amino acid transport system permease protein